LSSYQNGGVPGENLVVKESEYGQKYVSCTSPDRLGILEHSVNLSGEFEVVINADFKEGNWSKKILLTAGDSELDQLTVSFPAYSINFGDNSSSNNWIEYSSINTLRLSVKDGVAKLYINDYFRGKLTLSNPDTIYTKLLINGITNNDRLFEVKGRNITGTVTQPSSLAVDFGNKGLYLYDGATFTGLVGWNPDNMLGWKNRLVADFNDRGLWIYSGGKWSGAANWDAENMTVWGDKLLADFGESGLWAYNGTTWTGLADLDCENMQVWKNSLVGDFGDAGLWIYDGSTWTGVAGWNAENMVVWGDKLLADFGGKGLWIYNGSTWTGLVGWNADNMTVWGDKLLVDFGGSGLYMYNGSAWTGLVGWDTENMELVGF
jgi:hypothetical protein